MPTPEEIEAAAAKKTPAEIEEEERRKEDEDRRIAEERRQAELQEEEDEEEEEQDLNELTVKKLRALLKLRNMSPTGTKDELVQRLQAALDAEKLIDKVDKVDKDGKSGTDKEEKKPPDKPNIKDDATDDKLEKVEKQLNHSKIEMERKERQLKLVNDKLLAEQKKISDLNREKTKLLKLHSPTNTEDFRRRTKADIEKRKAKKKVFQDDEDDDVQSEGGLGDVPVHDDDDKKSQASRYSQNWSIFGMTDLQKILAKIEKSLIFAEKAKRDHSEDKEVIKSARTRCLDAQEFAEKSADKCQNVSVEDKEEVEDMMGELDDMVLSLDLALSSIDRVRSEKATGLKPHAPSWNSSHPSGFLSFHLAFKESFKHQHPRIKCESYRGCITGPDKRATLSLIAGIDNDFDKLERIMMDNFGNIETLLPSERQKIEVLRPAHNDEEEKTNLLIILEYYHLLQSHQAEKHFDFHLQFIIKSKLTKAHCNDLRLRKPRNVEEFIARLEEYLADISEYLRVIPQRKREEERGGRQNGGNRYNSTGGNLPGTRQFNSRFEPRKRCCLCKNEGSHWTSDCNSLKNKTQEDIKEIFRRKNACYSCLRPLGESHISPCNQYYNKNLQKKVSRNCRCGSELSSLICCNKGRRGGALDSTTPGGGGGGAGGGRHDVPGTASRSTKIQETKKIERIELNGSCGIGASVTNSQLLNIKLPGTTQTVQALCVFDSQSENTIIDSSLRKYLSGYKETIFSVDTLNNSMVRRGGVAALTVVANDNKEYEIRGLVTPIHNRHVRRAKFIIPEKWRKQFNMKPEEFTCAGQICVVFGADIKQYFPSKIDSYGGVDLEQSFFDRKLILSGYNKGEVFNGADNARVCSSNRAKMLSLDSKWLELMNPSQAILTPGLCEEHRGKQSCVKCKNQIMTMSRLQLHENNLLGDGLTFNESEGHWVVQAPYKATLKDVPDYEKETTAAMQRLTRKLKVIPNGERYAAALDKTVEDNISKGLWAWEDQLIKENKDFDKFQKISHPINYSLKPEGSSTTPVRLVFNLSQSRADKPSFNDAQLTGSSLNQKLHLILLRNRGYKYLSYSDIIAFYNQIRLSPKDQRLHSFSWRKNGILNEDEDFKTICSQVLVFGGRMSQNLSNLAKIRTSEAHILPVDSSVHDDIIHSYTDDVGTVSNVSMEDLGRKQKIMEEGLKKGGFSLKKWTTSFDKNEEEINISGFSSSALLGLFYQPSSDSWTIKIKVNFSKKQRNLRPQEDEIKTREELRTFIATKGLTKLNALQAAHFAFDPLCLLLPLKGNLSLAYRLLLIKNPGMQYSDKIPEDQIQLWTKIIGDLLDAREVKIPRCVLPATYGPETEVSLAAFSDGGESASTTRIFIRSSLPGGGFHVQNLLNSFKLGNLSTSGSPRSEIQGFLAAARQIELIVSVWKHIKFSDIHLFSDSELCLGSLQSYNSKLSLYFSERVLEIQTIVENHNVKVHYIRSDLNPANEGSKLNLTDNPIMTEEYWTVPFLLLPEEQWPVRDYHYDITDIASLINPKMANQEEKLKCFSTKMNTDVMDLLGRFTFTKTVSILACPLQWMKKYRGDTVKAQAQARELLFGLARPSEQQITGLKRQYLIEREGEDVHLISRPFTLEKDKTFSKKLRLLDGRSPVGRSILRSYHVHCSSTDREISNLFEDGLFLAGCRAYLRKLQRSCKACLRIRKETVQQYMGPSQQIVASKYPSYYFSFSDIVGPIFVTTDRPGTRGARRRRAYILSLTCIWSRHITFTLVNDLTAASFLAGILTIGAQLGGAVCRYLYSDYGTNIVAIKKLCGEEYPASEAGAMAREMQSTFRSNQIQLHLSSPHASHRQSLVERLHRSLKQSLRRADIMYRTHDIGKWNFILAKIGQTLNDRPLNIRFVQETFNVLTPNKLIFGSRQNYYPANIDLNLSGHRLYEQLDSLEKSVNHWRDLWTRTYLIEVSKYVTFKTKTRDLRVGDVVMISDHKNSASSTNTLGQIVEVLSERTMRLKYVQRPARCDKDGNIVKPARIGFLIRPVQNLIYLTCPSERSSNLDPFVEWEKAPSPTTTTTTTAPTSSTTSATPDDEDPDGVPAPGTDADDVTEDAVDDDDNMDTGVEAAPAPPAQTIVNRPGVKVKYFQDGIDTIQDIIVNTVKNKKGKKNPRKS